MNPKLQELQRHVWWAGDRWLKECKEKNLQFTILEVYRPQWRQDALYAKGRWTKGKVVTWTLNSLHTQRLACDIKVINCTYNDVQAVALKYGITRPLAVYPYYDEGHFQFDKVKSYPIILSVGAKLRALQRAIKRKIEPVKTMLKNQYKRILSRT